MIAIKRTHPLKNAESIPLGRNQSALVQFHEFGELVVHGFAIRVFRQCASNDDKRVFRVLEFLHKRSFASHEIIQRRCILAQEIISIGGISTLADHPNLKASVQPALTDARVENSGFVTGVGANEKDGICLLNTGYGSIEEVI